MNRLLVITLLFLYSSLCAAIGPYYLGATIADAQADKRSAVQLWNPTSEAYCVSSVTIASSNTNGMSGADIRSIFAPVGVFMNSGSNKIIGSASGVELRSANFVPAEIPTTSVIYEIWMRDAFNDRTYDFKPAIKLPPNSGILVTDAHNNTYLIVSFQFFGC